MVHHRPLRVHLINESDFQPLEPTVEDIYCANVISERSIVECFRFYDTAGLVSGITQ